MPVYWCMRLDLVFLVGRTMSDGGFWGVCDLIMILGSFSANGWGWATFCLFFSVCLQRRVSVDFAPPGEGLVWS